MAQLEFYGNVIVAFRLKVVTGLHIGGNKESFEIGGLDNPVMRLPEKANIRYGSFFEGEIKVSGGQPYIPGSSLKGKIRSLLEWAKGDVEIQEEKKENKVEVKGISGFKDPEIVKLFGAPANLKGKEEKNKELYPIRGRFLDVYPVEKVETELKVENQIDRITSAATPRFFERVPAGTEFEGAVVIKLFSESDADLLRLLAEGFSLLEDDYLGGSGSRGYGRVKFVKLKAILRDKNYYLGKDEEKLIADKEFESVKDFMKEVPGQLKKLLKKEE